jgi:hypothetical protein
VKQANLHINVIKVRTVCRRDKLKLNLKYYFPADAFEVEMVIEKFKAHKSPDIDQIPVELVKAGGRTIRYEIQKLINYIWNKEELPEEWKKSIILRIYRKGDKTDFSNYRGISLLSNTYKLLSNILLSRLNSK